MNLVDVKREIVSNLKINHPGKWVNPGCATRTVPLGTGINPWEALNELVAEGVVNQQLIDDTYPLVRYVPKIKPSLRRIK